jgi:hypothetical protein
MMMRRLPLRIEVSDPNEPMATSHAPPNDSTVYDWQGARAELIVATDRRIGTPAAVLLTTGNRPQGSSPTGRVHSRISPQTKGSKR